MTIEAMFWTVWSFLKLCPVPICSHLTVATPQITIAKIEDDSASLFIPLVAVARTLLSPELAHIAVAPRASNSHICQSYCDRTIGRRGDQRPISGPFATCFAEYRSLLHACPSVRETIRGFD